MSPRKYLNKIKMKKMGKLKPKEGIFISERRKHPRFSLELPLDYSIESIERYGGVAANASTDGLLVYLPEPILVGTLLNIEILFVKGSELNSIKARAKIVWSDLAPKEISGKYRYGLEFKSFQEGGLKKLRRLLKEADKTLNRSIQSSLSSLRMPSMTLCCF